MPKQSVRGKATEDLQSSAGELKGEEKGTARLQQFPHLSQSFTWVRGNTEQAVPQA